jgi:hypothetical protein
MANARIRLHFFEQNRQFRPLAQISLAIFTKYGCVRIAGLALRTYLHSGASLTSLEIGE